MVWVSILAVLVLFLSFGGGVKDGAVKSFFSLIALIIAIPLAGISYRLLATALSFLPGEDWENFVGFFITLAIISAIFQLIFLLPRKIIQKIWSKGLIFRLTGGILNLFNSALGMAVFTLLVIAYPIAGWLEQAVTGSGVLTWLVTSLGFVKAMLPEVFQAGVITAFLG